MNPIREAVVRGNAESHYSASPQADCIAAEVRKLIRQEAAAVLMEHNDAEEPLRKLLARIEGRAS